MFTSQATVHLIVHGAAAVLTSFIFVAVVAAFAAVVSLAELEPSGF